MKIYWKTLMKILYLKGYKRLFFQSQREWNYFFGYRRYYALAKHIKPFFIKNIKVKGCQYPDYLSSFNTHGRFISFIPDKYDIRWCVDKIAFIFNTSSAFLFQSEANLIYYFHGYFIFDFVLDVLIVVCIPRVFLIEVKVNIFLFFFVYHLLFCNWINICIFFY